MAGVLVAVFSCMLVYQLLSHERKKMYWEQLELRCRSLYAGPQPPLPQVTGAPSLIGTPRGGPCRCCEQCHSHRNVIPSAYPWDGDSRFWGPVPGQAGNFYSPNPGGETGSGMVGRNHNPVPTSRNQRPGWSWPRLPWQRSDAQRFRQTPSSPDSQYGFSNGNNVPDTAIIQTASGQNSGYSVIGGPPHYGIWGPPPPYSDPNSPARRGRYQYIHPSQCQQIADHNMVPQPSNLTVLECHQHGSSTDSHSMEPFCPQQQQQSHHRSMIKRQNASGFGKAKEHYENTPSDSDVPRDRFSNTLPTRKTKKRIEIGAKSIGPNQSAARVNVQNVFGPSSASLAQPQADSELYPNDGNMNEQQTRQCQLKQQQRNKTGIENSGFLAAEKLPDDKIQEPSESEVYFADVSSCCNISVKNDNFYDETNQAPRRTDKYCATLSSNGTTTAKEDKEDYLVQRFGKREASIRRIPYSQIIGEDYEKPQMTTTIVTASRAALIHKDVSRQSMCSVDSGEKTDYTDLSPATPCSAFGNAYTMDDNGTDPLSFQHVYPNTTHFIHSNSSSSSTSKYKKPDFSDVLNSNFISSPFSSYSSCDGQSDGHRRVEQRHNNVIGQNEMYLAPDAQYEMIKESSTLNISSSTAPLQLNYDHRDISTMYNGGNNGGPQQTQHMSSHHYHQKPKSPKNMNITPIKRQSLGTNITAIIQNLGGSDVGLLYPDNRREDEIDSQQDCISKSTKTISDNEWSDHSDRRL